jgi:hypothetical protein
VAGWVDRVDHVVDVSEELNVPTVPGRRRADDEAGRPAG